MKVPAMIVLLVATFGGSLFASESYVVVRLIDPDRREALARSGAREVTHPDLRADEVLLHATSGQLNKLQNEPNVLSIYPASAELIAGVPVHACTPPKSDLIAEYILNVGRGWNPGTSIPVTLTYSIQGFSSKVGREQTLEIFEQALAEWAKYIQIQFTRTDSYAGKRNLNVLFASGAHGDPYPFDGPRRTLAHTFYPGDVNPEPIAGDLHFDEDENWGSGVDPDLHSVVLHELGHALGLGHSDKPTAVMYPYYRRLNTLLPDDIEAIRRLYPAREEAPVDPPAPEPDPAPSAPPPAPVEPVTPPVPSQIDKTAPTLRILSPAVTILATSSTTARISGTAWDSNGIARVTWTAPGGREGVANGTTTWTVPDLALRPGDNSIVIRAYDPAGNMSWRNLTITRR